MLTDVKVIIKTRTRQEMLAGSVRASPKRSNNYGRIDRTTYPLGLLADVQVVAWPCRDGIDFGQTDSVLLLTNPRGKHSRPQSGMFQQHTCSILILILGMI